MNGYREYARLAYRRTILSAMQRFLESHVASETPSQMKLECEEVLASDREVPEDAFTEMLHELQVEEQKARLQIAEFEFRRKDVREQEKPTAAVKQEPAKRTAGS